MPPRRPLSPANQGGTEAGPSSKKRRVEATGSKSNTGPAQKKTPSSAKSSSKSGSSGAADNSNKQAMGGNLKQKRLDKGKGKARATDSDVDSVESEGNEDKDESAAEARGEENLSSSYRLDVRLTSGSRHSLAYNPSTTMPQSNRRRLTLNESRRRSPR